MIEQTCIKKEHYNHSKQTETSEETHEKNLSKEEMINTSVHSNNLCEDEKIFKNHAITIVNEDNKLYIRIKKDPIMFCKELNDDRLLMEKSLFNQNKSLNNRIQKKRNLDNILDYDNFLKEIYTIPKQTTVKKTEIKKINKKVKKYSLNKDVMKTSVKKKNNSLKNSSLYDLDNFIISSNTSKTFKKDQINLKIFTPNYKTLETKFFQSPNFFISKPSDKCDDDLNNDEDISDETYLKYHNEFERREREYRINFFNHKKQKSKTLKKVDYDDNNITISRFEENLTNREDI